MGRLHTQRKAALEHALNLPVTHLQLRALPQVLQQTESAVASVERQSEAQREAHRRRTPQQTAPLATPADRRVPGHRGSSDAHGEAREFFEARLRAEAEGGQAAAPSAAEEEQAEDAAAQVLMTELINLNSIVSSGNMQAQYIYIAPNSCSTLFSRCLVAIMEAHGAPNTM